MCSVCSACSSSSRYAQKPLPNPGACWRWRQFGGCAHRQHAPAAVHKPNAVAARGFVHKMGGNKNGDFVLPRKLEADEHQNILARGRVDTRSGLVENQHLGLVQAGGGQFRQALASMPSERSAGRVSATSAKSNCTSASATACLPAAAGIGKAARARADFATLNSSYSENACHI